jgi:hypothetical protein
MVGRATTVVPIPTAVDVIPTTVAANATTVVAVPPRRRHR